MHELGGWLCFFFLFVCFFVFFFFKQKTAYEMCGRDWSSDVCSSDLTCLPPAVRGFLHIDSSRTPASTLDGWRHYTANVVDPLCNFSFYLWFSCYIQGRIQANATDAGASVIKSASMIFGLLVINR